MKIGIVGSGIAGLVAAWSLDQRGCAVTVFEKTKAPGMDAHAARFSVDGSELRADVPSRMFNEHQWPTLCQLYRKIGIETSVVPNKQSFRQRGTDRVTNLALPWTLADAWSFTWSAEKRQFATWVQQFREQGKRDLESGISESETLATYLKSARVAHEFVENYLYPVLSSTVGTCSYQSLDALPASILLQVLQNIDQPAELKRVRCGTRAVVSRLVKNLSELRLGTPVRNVRPHADHIEIAYETTAGQLRSDRFDHVILATQANHLGQLLDPSLAAELEIGQLFDYEPVTICLHQQPHGMPLKQSQWSTFNFTFDADQRWANCTVWLNRFHDDWPMASNLFQTISPSGQHLPTEVLTTSRLERPVVRVGTLQALHRLAKLHRQPNRRIWFCGSYAAHGMPLLESAASSACEVVRLIESRSTPAN